MIDRKFDLKLEKGVIFEKSPDGNNGIVRIFKAWDIEFVGRGIKLQVESGE